jgi:hypothetical protein
VKISGRVANLAAAILLASCVTNQTSQVTDVTTPEAVVLSKTEDQGEVHALLITGSGEIRGRGEISLILNGEVYLAETLSGTVAFRWETDWYADEAEIRYTPELVTEGDLSLKYQFRDFRD